MYDADGRVIESGVPDEYIKSTYDASGQLTRLEKPSERDIYRSLDGGGREAKRKKLTYREDGNDDGSWVEEIKYFIRSSVLGGEVVSEADATGRKLKTIIRAAGATLAWQTLYYGANSSSEYVNFEHRDASGSSYRATTNNGIEIYGEGGEGAPAEFDPFGGNVGLSTPYIEPEPQPQPTYNPEYPSLQAFGIEDQMFVNGQRVTCELDGLAIGCSQVSSNSAAACPNNNCGAQVFTNSRGQSVISSGFQAYSDGTSGYRLPVWDNNSFTINGETTRYRSQLIGWENRQVSYSYSNWSPTWQTREKKKPADLAPPGYASDKKLTAEECDNRLARIFGDENSLVGSTNDPTTLGSFDVPRKALGDKFDSMMTGARSAGHGPKPYPEGLGSDKGGIIHIYADSRGFAGGPLYAPAGGRASPIALDSQRNEYRRVSYKTGLTITFVHTAFSSENDVNKLGSVRIGNIGGEGGDTSGYIHSHLVFFSNFAKRERVDPREVFCGW